VKNKFWVILLWAFGLLDIFCSTAFAEPMSTAMALLYGSLAGGGMAGLGSWLGGQGKKDMEQGYDIVQMPTYDWAEGTQQGTNEYLMQMLDALKKGKTPAYMSYLDPIQQGMQKNLSDTFYGTAGRHGTLQDVMNAASITGVGPRAAMNKSTQASADYLSESDKIDQYISGLKYNNMSSLATQVPSMLSSMPRGPETQVVNLMGGVGAGNQNAGMGEALGGMASQIPWSSIFQGSGSGSVWPTASQYASFGGKAAGSTPSGYPGTIRKF